MAYVVGELHEELGIMPHYHDPQLIDGMQGNFATCTGHDNEWSKGRFMLDGMARDPGIEGFFHVRTVQRSGTNQWHIWDLGPFCSDSGD